MVLVVTVAFGHYSSIARPRSCFPVSKNLIAMPLSNTVLRQYTPPTCTLEITARTSPLARGGTTSSSRRTVIELLSFVLRFDDPRMPESEPVVVRGNYQQFMDLHAAVNTYVQDLLKTSPENFNTTVYADASRLAPVSGVQSGEVAIPLESQEVALNELNPPDRKICLEPTDSGLAHKLFFGSLSTKHSATVIQLSVVQLFDLMTALDECAADLMVAAPNAYSRPSPRSAPSTWANIAAVLLLAVGITTAVAVFLNRTNSSPKRQVAQNPIQNNPSPTAVVPSPLPTLSATPLPSSLPSPQKLPPLPPLTGTTTPNSTKRGQGVNIPQETTSSPISLPGVVVPPPPPSILSTPVVPDRSSYGNPPESSLPKVDSTHQESSKQRHQPPTANSPAPIANLPGTNLPVLTPGNPDLRTNTSPSTSVRRNKETPFLPGALTAPEVGKGTAFDTIPQVAEARNYFKQRWEPPSGLTQTLQYSLLLDNNGTIQRIIPLGEASRKFVDRSGMPLVGERFVSPISNGHTPTIRVVLSPDGQVQTFLESD